MTHISGKKFVVYGQPYKKNRPTSLSSKFYFHTSIPNTMPRWKFFWNYSQITSTSPVKLSDRIIFNLIFFHKYNIYRLTRPSSIETRIKFGQEQTSWNSLFYSLLRPTVPPFSLWANRPLPIIFFLKHGHVYCHYVKYKRTQLTYVTSFRCVISLAAI